jgi:hypothetical protein
MEVCYKDEFTEGLAKVTMERKQSDLVYVLDIG